MHAPLPIVQTTQRAQKSSVDPEEVARFAAMAAEWWDERGKFRPLHAMNPVRLGYVKSMVCRHFGREETTMHALQGLQVLDVGCGGGLVAEPLARMGGQVIAIDAAQENIDVARTHAEQSGVAVDYRATTAEALAASGARFDLVTALEIVEHVADVPGFVDSLAALLKPGGLLIMSTLNRTGKSYALAIVGAEYVLRLVPRGTHQWRKFLKPSELVRELRRSGLQHENTTGLVMHPLSGTWRLDAQDLSVNYLLAATSSR